MADGVSIRVEGTELATRSAEAIASRTENPRHLFDLIGASLAVSTQRRFETGTAPDGSAWPPSFRALATGGKTLVESARLMQSMTHQASDTGIEIGTNVVYAAIHQLGGTIRQAPRLQTIFRRYDARTDTLSARFVKRRKSNFSQDFPVGERVIHMPARPFLGIDDDDEREIRAISEEWLGGPDAEGAADAA